MAPLRGPAANAAAPSAKTQGTGPLVETLPCDAHDHSWQRPANEMKSLWYIKLFVQRGVTAANKPCRSASFGRNGPALPLTADERAVL